jgi:2,4-dienoyl-CoA reductase-like NADH-dependent reductase (Old Yellow Enzyme family)
MNIYDGFPYPFGFGVQEGSMEPDLAEPVRLIRELREAFHITIINLTMGNPYKNPHVNRPYDRGSYLPDEHPFQGLGRMMKSVSDVQAAIPGLPVLGSAFTYLRQFSVNLAAGMVAGGHCTMAGFGRMAFAYPDFVQEARRSGRLDKQKICVTCGNCAVLLRTGVAAGCVVHDKEVYKL